MNFMSVVNDLGTSVKKNSYGILLVTGVIGFVGGGVLAVMATPKALTLIEAKKEEEGVDDLSAVDTVKTVWKCYIPAVATFVLSAGCIVLASNINHRRNAALMTAYAISEGALKEYHDKVVEVVGDKKEKEIKDGEKVLRSERYFGQVARAFSLAQDVDDASAEASYKDGVLVLEGDVHLADGTSFLQRIAWSEQDDGVRERAELSRDGGKTWAPAFDVLFRKRAGGTE